MKYIARRALTLRSRPELNRIGSLRTWAPAVRMRYSVPCSMGRSSISSLWPLPAIQNNYEACCLCPKNALFRFRRQIPSNPRMEILSLPPRILQVLATFKTRTSWGPTRLQHPPLGPRPHPHHSHRLPSKRRRNHRRLNLPRLNRQCLSSHQRYQRTKTSQRRGQWDQTSHRLREYEPPEFFLRKF
jgi:hypothetical protein